MCSQNDIAQKKNIQIIFDLDNWHKYQIFGLSDNLALSIDKI